MSFSLVDTKIDRNKEPENILRNTVPEETLEKSLPTDVINPNNMCLSIACTSQTLLWLSKKMRYFTTFFVAPLVIQLFVPYTLLVKSTDCY